MNILICSDKFKMSLSASEVCHAIAQGIITSYPRASITILPLADGGDGTLDVLRESLRLEEISVPTTDPLHRPIHAKYLSDRKTAYVELAEASGIWRLHPSELDVMHTTTLGTGTLMRHAIDQGHSEITLCLGGSCTNDVGLGIAKELGFGFLDSNGGPVVPAGGTLSDISSITGPEKPYTTKLRILCDVDNPLYGPDGAAFVYGPQKGADQDHIRALDKGMRHIEQLIRGQYNKTIGQIKGAGAAGGIAAGLYGLLDEVVLENGLLHIAELVALEDKIKSADIIITGEGQLDSQSLHGKVVSKVADLVHHHGNKVMIAIVGRNTLTDTELEAAHIAQCHSILSVSKDLADAMANGEKYLTAIAQQLDLG